MLLKILELLCYLIFKNKIIDAHPYFGQTPTVLFVYTQFIIFLYFQPKKKTGKRVAAAPLAVKKQEVKKVVNPLFEKRPRNFGIGKW